MTDLTWKIADNTARTQIGNWQLMQQPTAPAHGVLFKSSSAEADQKPWTVFAVEPLPAHALLAEEAYVRQRDLIVRFDQSEQDQFAFQLDYRLLETPELPDFGMPLVGLELWASVQTDDLDSEPVLNVACQSPEGECWEIRAHSQVLEKNDSGSQTSLPPAALIARTDSATAVWLIEPTDQRNAALLSTPAEPQQRVEMFGHFMEKGVIRRARMRFHLIHGELTDEQLLQLYQKFAASPLPLTA